MERNVSPSVPPILEHDGQVPGILEPGEIIRSRDVPERCVLCFFQEAIEAIREETGAGVAVRLYSEIGRTPLYDLRWQGERVGLFHPGVGAPLAAAFLEELIALGVRKFLVCGSAGVLEPGHPLGEVLVPTAAVRDEGTSYHYLPADREAVPTPAAIETIRTVLAEQAIPFRPVRTWTTDGLYRETRPRMERRKAAGCVTVEMEAAALFAVAAHRNVTLGQVLYASDDLSGEQWDSRDFTRRKDARMALARLALDIAVRL